MSSPIEVVDAFDQAYARRDVDALMALTTPEVEVLDVSGARLMDRAQMHELYASLFRDSPDLEERILQRLVVGDVVVQDEEIHGMQVSGFPTDLRAVVAAQVHDGKVARLVFLSIVDLNT